MEMSRIKQLAGLKHHVTEGEAKLFQQLNEVVEIPQDITMDELIQRLDACKRALAIVNKMQDPADKKKWMSATFVNLNKVRAALQRMLASLDTANTVAGGDVTQTARMVGTRNAA